MTSEPLVATLVAAQGSQLLDSHISHFSEQLHLAGGDVSDVSILEPGKAADVFFSGCGISGEGYAFDVLVQPTSARRKKFLIADMESTIIEQEMLDILAARIGVGETVANITRRAMNGELDFGAALSERVLLLKGQPASLLEDVAEEMVFSPQAEAFVRAMKRSGARAWLVSGGFTCFVSKIAEMAGFDRFYANQLKVEGGVITGEVVLPILGKETKREILNKACAEYGCTLSETLSVGDGANDLPMLLACQAGGGLAVAYRAKPSVRQQIASQINYSDFAALIYAQGLG